MSESTDRSGPHRGYPCTIWCDGVLHVDVVYCYENYTIHRDIVLNIVQRDLSSHVGCEKLCIHDLRAAPENVPWNDKYPEKAMDEPPPYAYRFVYDFLTDEPSVVM